MRVRHLSLTNFRLYARLEADLPAGSLILVGANAQGKTSLLEAIYYFATAQAHHAASDRQLINFLALAARETLPFAKLIAEVAHRDRQRRVEIRVILDPANNPAGRPLRSASRVFEGAGGGDSRLRKEIYINGVKKRVSELAGLVNVVLFLPQDLAIVEGAPADRRRHLDIALCQVNPAYNFALGEYGKVLTQRNALLKMLQDSPGHAGVEAQLDFWDVKLCEHGALLIAARAAALAEMEALASAIHRDLTGGAEGLRLAYHPAFDPAAAPHGRRLLETAVDLDARKLGQPSTEDVGGEARPRPDLQGVVAQLHPVQRPRNDVALDHLSPAGRPASPAVQQVHGVLAGRLSQTLGETASRQITYKPVNEST